MGMLDGKVAVITGSGRGIGREIALLMAKEGAKVVVNDPGVSAAGQGSADAKVADEVVAEIKAAGGAAAANYDSVASGEGAGRIIKTALDAFGRIDVVVNNAGVSHSGPVEDTELAVALAMFETNYLGAVRVARSALPAMRRQGSGTVVIVGSAAGKIGVPFQAHYAASKFAVEGLAEALYHELRPFGLRVLLIEPGDVGTTIWERNKGRAPEGSPYFQAMERFLAVKDREMGERAARPEAVAREIADIIESPTSRLRHPVARGAGLILAARKLLPDRIFLWAVARNYRIR